MLLMPSPRTGKIPHKENSAKLRSSRQGIQNLLQQRPLGMDIPNHTEDGAQNEGFMCMTPQTTAITSN